MMTTDIEASLTFYTKLMNWRIQPVDLGDMGTYHMIHVGEQPIGGFVSLDSSHGIPSHWIPYITTPSVDDTCEEATRLGGQVCVPPTDIPQTGRFAVVTGPTGEVFSPFRFAFEEPPAASGTPGTFCYDELLTSDTEKAKAFYGDLFQWQVEGHDMGDMGIHFSLNSGGQEKAGMMALPEAAKGAPSHWLTYLMVEQLEEKAHLAQSLGATILVPPSPIPGIGRFAVLMDPSQAVFGLFSQG
jgi:hypothetical protein